MEPKQVVPGEDVADQGGGTGELPGVSPQPVESRAQRCRPSCVEAQASSRRRPDAWTRHRPVRAGRVVPDGDAPCPSGIVVDADQVEALTPSGAPAASEIDAGVSSGAHGRFREPLLGAKIARREGSLQREHVQRSARRGSGLRIEPEDGHPRAQRRHSSLGHAPASSKFGGFGR